MFLSFDDCLIKFQHCFDMFIICLFHVWLSKPNADMELFKPFCRLFQDPLIVQKGNEDCFALWFIVPLVEQCLILLHIVQKQSKKGVLSKLAADRPGLAYWRTGTFPGGLPQKWPAFFPVACFEPACCYQAAVDAAG